MMTIIMNEWQKTGSRRKNEREQNRKKQSKQNHMLYFASCISLGRDFGVLNDRIINTHVAENKTVGGI